MPSRPVRIVLTASRTVGGAASASQSQSQVQWQQFTAVVTVQDRTQAVALCCHLQARSLEALEAVHQVRRGNQQPARSPTVRRPARSALELVDGRRKKNAAHTGISQ